MKDNEFKELLQSIDQARTIHRGKRKPSRTFRYDPSIKVKEIRIRLGLTQEEFAETLCISVATVRNWEQGRTYPEGPAISLLKIFEAMPQESLKALHAQAA